LTSGGQGRIAALQTDHRHRRALHHRRALDPAGRGRGGRRPPSSSRG
jgi:hypothetical protein